MAQVIKWSAIGVAIAGILVICASLVGEFIGFSSSIGTGIASGISSLAVCWLIIL